jgi:hypothetical protein
LCRWQSGSRGSSANIDALARRSSPGSGEPRVPSGERSLDLQVSPPAEPEITRLLERLEGMTEHLAHGGRALDELKQGAEPERVVHLLDEADHRPAGWAVRIGGPHDLSHHGP